MSTPRHRRELARFLDRNSVTRRIRGPRKARKPYALAPGIESLEDRTLLTVTANLSSGLLDISLSASGDSAAVVADGKQITVNNTMMFDEGLITGINAHGTSSSSQNSNQTLTLTNTAASPLD